MCIDIWTSLEVRWEKDKFEHNHPSCYPKWHIHSHSYIIATNFPKHWEPKTFTPHSAWIQRPPNLPYHWHQHGFRLPLSLLASLLSSGTHLPSKWFVSLPYRHLLKDPLSLSWKALMKVCALRFFESVTSPWYFHQSWTAVSWFFSNPK